MEPTGRPDDGFPLRWINDAAGYEWRAIPYQPTIGQERHNCQSSAQQSRAVDALRDERNAPSGPGPWMNLYPSDLNWSNVATESSAGITYPSWFFAALCAAVERGVPGASPHGTRWSQTAAFRTSQHGVSVTASRRDSTDGRGTDKWLVESRVWQQRSPSPLRAWPCGRPLPPFAAAPSSSSIKSRCGPGVPTHAARLRTSTRQPHGGWRELRGSHDDRLRRQMVLGSGYPARDVGGQQGQPVREKRPDLLAPVQRAFCVREPTNSWTATRGIKGPNEGADPDCIVHVLHNNAIDVVGRRFFKKNSGPTRSWSMTSTIASG